MTTPLRLLFVGLAVLAAAGGAVQASAQVASGRMPPLDGQAEQGALPNRLAASVGLNERLGASVSPDLVFADEAGRPVRLGNLLTGDRPVLLVFAYHSCPMLCSLVLDGVADAVKDVDLAPASDYEVLVVSVDPRDTPARADSVKARYVQRIGTPEAAAGLHFWTVTERTEASVKRLADDVGFRYAYDVRTGEYAHTAVTVVLSPTGMVSRYLYGLDYAPRDVRLALIEASEGKTGTALDRFLLTCYEYDEHAQGYSLQVLSVLKILGGGMLLLFAGVVGPLWVREIRRQRTDVALGDLDAASTPDAPSR